MNPSIRSPFQEMYQQTSHPVHTVNLRPERPRSILTPVDLDYFRSRLLQREYEVLKEIREHQELLDRFIDLDFNKMDTVIRFMEVNGVDMLEMERRRKIVETQHRHLRQIHRALDRIEDGTYGICMITQRPISRSRLEQVPHAALCEDALCRSQEPVE